MQIHINTEQVSADKQASPQYVEVSSWVTQALDDRPKTPAAPNEPKRMVQMQLSPALILHTIKMKK